MAYYDERREYAPRDRGYTTEYYEENPRGGYARYEREVHPYRGSQDSIEEVRRDYPPGSEYAYERGYEPRRSAGRPEYEHMRRASSAGGYDPYPANGYYHRTRRTRHYDDHRMYSILAVQVNDVTLMEFSQAPAAPDIHQSLLPAPLHRLVGVASHWAKLPSAP